MFNYLTKPTDNVPDAILNTMGKIKKKKKNMVHNFKGLIIQH